jgi:hypothetical protein
MDGWRGGPCPPKRAIAENRALCLRDRDWCPRLLVMACQSALEFMTSLEYVRSRPAERNTAGLATIRATRALLRPRTIRRQIFLDHARVAVDVPLLESLSGT